VAISATFWRSLKMVGNQDTLEVMGTPETAGKGEPNQVIRGWPCLARLPISLTSRFLGGSKGMHEYFYTLGPMAITVATSRATKIYTCTFRGEGLWTFVRFHRSAVRQAGTVAAAFF